jgi:hypothetical protein
MKVSIKMLKSLIGEPPYKRGLAYEVEQETAEQWALAGLCEINKKSNNANESKRTTSGGAGKQNRGKGLAKG